MSAEGDDRATDGGAGTEVESALVAALASSDVNQIVEISSELAKVW